MKKSGIDSLNNSDYWSKLYNLLHPDMRSVYFCPEFYKAYQKVEPYPAECFWLYKDEENFLFYPYLKRTLQDLDFELKREYFDLCGAYGYNGPLGVVSDPEFLVQFNRELSDYLKESGVVTEFVRYSPLPDNRSFHTYTQQLDVLDNVFIDLSKGLDWLWTESFKSGVRKAINRSKGFGLSTVVKSGSDVNDYDRQIFYNIYQSTMQRNNADAFYLFSEGYFKDLFSSMGDNILLYFTTKDEVATTTESVLVDGAYAYGFLGGTLNQYYDMKVNTYQRWEIIRDLSARGVLYYSLGGSNQRGDGVYQFKLSFAQHCENPFFIGTHIHNETAYREIITQWEQKHPHLVQLCGNKLQRYRSR